uniref:Germin-like protein 9-2 n=1 Tax=Nicotiana sylvestris TaxID=4096 RepID=A0A1U7X0Y3_NICSY|nr:PREDICTED: putative germin-like protein 9-2 [Nicotiana sylvestris]
MAQAGDPDILIDSIVPENRTGDTIDGNFFTFTDQIFVWSVIARSWMAQAGDLDILTDFIVPENRIGDTLDGNFFTFTGMREIFGSVIISFKLTKASKAEFPALDGQCTSLVVLQFPGAGVNPPYTHPRASELFLVVHGILEVGLLDSSNKLSLDPPLSLSQNGAEYSLACPEL